MTPEEIKKALSHQQTLSMSHSQNFDGLLRCYMSAAVVNDRTRMNEIENNLHNVLNLNLDAMRSIAYYSQMLLQGE